ncbi:Integral membrane protein, YccS/YhfK family [Azotobacter vinelandii CA]|uniref:Integral membrane protein, YccS/YhfK family n=2 Tax=Azotobacter vinelandii TaxID=354 RepID=C1DKF9_AZOVD|nr:YccS family putative transporter [Azotobacter vinelandii]ACO76822.1 Integral membrane protein, YccS/YhfK family [Azotobacter vinelandii DJ]AGK17242.1 Integral membrane protein, YccS/YhfK family [Azotobacter vinelandii CA]AGK19395.1 Integral membrane protein, YccS/YhfK family [Azotobacter vinelandii CA6]WKN22577.1 YccS family putative transporter [Azotobacter vinelandii]SFX67239.1 TIGR01666 family membrane protein [Azotobacter vinelandii]
MPSTPFSQSLRQLWAHHVFSYSLRVFIALTGSMALCWVLDRMDLLIPLFLGIIASALAETDDSWEGRLQALLVTLACFAAAAFAVELLFPYPWKFAAALALSSFGLTMLGALGERYATIASGTLILSIYTMIGIDQRGGPPVDLWREPLVLVAGAAWYGVLSVIWQALFSTQPIQQSLARVFRELGEYLKLKASLFEPVRHLDVGQRRLELAQRNSRVVAALNAAKEIILHRVENGRPSPQVNRYLKLYFLAQDIHERASSSHYPYNALAEAFFHSDVLFRCRLVIRQQGKSCLALARAIELRQPFDCIDQSQALEDLHTSLAHLRMQSNPAWRHLLYSLGALADNLIHLDRLLQDARNPDALADAQDNSLLDREPQSLGEALSRLRQQMTPASRPFRHALRLAVALPAGYGLLHLIHPTQGYWILLTTLFVCQPNFGATRRRVRQRILGTVLGLLAGWALFALFPSLQVQALFAVVAGVVFFATRTSHYTLATAAITLLVLACFNQVGDSYGLIWPRLVDTLLGSLIAGLAVFLILPDWQDRQLNRVLANTLACNARYLRQLMLQYRSGKRDDLAYRLARRDAHNADAALSTTLAGMLMEPGQFRREADVGFRFLVLSHTLLSYLSALGAHREQLPEAECRPLLDEAAERLANSLEEIALELAGNRPVAEHDETEQVLLQRLEQLPEEQDDGLRLVQNQLALIAGQLAPLRSLAAPLQRNPVH